MRALRQTAVALLALLFVVAPIGGCAQRPDAAPAAKLPAKPTPPAEVKIGFLLVKEGPMAAWGKNMEMAYLLATEAVNAAGGIGGVKVRAVIYDTAGKPDQAALLTRKLATEDGVAVIVGPLASHEAAVAFPLANRLQVPMITGTAAQPGLAAQNRPWAYQFPMPDDLSIVEVAKYWVKAKNIKRVALVTDVKHPGTKIYGEVTFPKLFKELGVEVVTEGNPITYSTGDTDFRAQVTRLKALNFDGVALASLYTEAATLAREMRKQGINAPLVLTQAANNPVLIEVGGTAVEGAMLPSSWWPGNPDSKVQDFLRAWKAKYDGQPNLAGVYSYDAYQLVLHTLKTIGLTDAKEPVEDLRKRIRAALDTVSYQGVTGTTKFDQTGTGVHETYLQVVKQGRFEIGPIPR